MMPRARPSKHSEAFDADDVETLAISSILRDPTLQMRHRMEQRMVNRYASVLRSGTQMPPVTVANVGGALFLVDGWHRLAAAELVGMRQFPAKIIQTNEAGALWLAASANLTHGMPLKTKEIKNAFLAYVSSGQHRRGLAFKSYRDIAKDLGGVRSHTTIRNWMEKEFPSVYRAMGGGDDGNADGEPPPTPAISAFDLAREALHHLRAAAAGVSDPENRGELINSTAELLEELKQGGPWRYVAPEF